MKGGREHRVPLAEPALEILREMATARMSDGPDALVFPGRDAARPLSDMSLTAVLRRMKRGDLTAHGFRSAFRDWAAETTAYPAEIVEMALAHAVGNKVEAAYRRGDLFEKRQRLMLDWAVVLLYPRSKRPLGRREECCRVAGANGMSKKRTELASRSPMTAPNAPISGYPGLGLSGPRSTVRKSTRSTWPRSGLGSTMR